MSERERELLNIVHSLASEAGSNIVWGDVEKVRTTRGWELQIFTKNVGEQPAHQYLSPTRFKGRL
jgi:hypothetical protein